MCIEHALIASCPPPTLTCDTPAHALDHRHAVTTDRALDVSSALLIRRLRLQRMTLPPLALAGAGHVALLAIDSPATLWACLVLQAFVAGCLLAQLFVVDAPWAAFLRMTLPSHRLDVPFSIYLVSPLLLPPLLAPLLALLAPQAASLLATASLFSILFATTCCHLNSRPLLQAHRKLVESGGKTLSA